MHTRIIVVAALLLALVASSGCGISDAVWLGREVYNQMGGAKEINKEVSKAISDNKTKSETNQDDKALIKAAQAKLAELGFNPGPADGIMGPNTRAAIKAFQEKGNLPVTGELDDKTTQALKIIPVQTTTTTAKE